MTDHSSPSSAEYILIAEDSDKHDKYCLNLINDGLSEMRRRIDPRERIDINIGFDLGTSNSKLVWRYRDKSYPVRFGSDPDSLSSYLYPSTVFYDGRTLQTGYDSDKDVNWRVEFTVTNFKVCLACEYNPNSKCKINHCTLANWNLDHFEDKLRGSEVSFIMSYYLASVLSMAKELIVTAFEQKFGRINPANIRWAVNMAVPNRFMTYDNITSEYKSALKTGWLMSIALKMLLKKSSVRLMKQCYFHARAIASTEEMDCFVIPETVAQVTSFIRSRNTGDGLYALVDIGAGTVDASVFRIYTPPHNQRQLSDYATKVLNTGSAFIESLAFYWFSHLDWYPDSIRRRSKFSKQRAENLLRSALRQMKENGGRPVSGYTQIPESDLNQSLKEASVRIGDRVHELLKQLFIDAYQVERNINKWTDLKVIFGGGGARSPVYKKASTEAFTIFFEGRKLAPKVIEFNISSDFQLGNLKRDQFHRFAVAYGLSLSELEMMKFHQNFNV